MITLEEIIAPIKSEIDIISQNLAEQARTDIPLLNSISDYTLQSPGKRIRPAMLLLTAKSINQGQVDLEKIIQAASIIEYIHTATLLHDDVVDIADMRRSKRTARSVWGNKASVLVGDYLFTMSFQRLAKFNDVKIIGYVADTTTLMAKGELLQLMHTVDTASLGTYMEIIKCKTSVLFALAAQLGAYLGDGDEEMVQSMHSFGLNYGDAFQIADDIIDYASESEQSGKIPGSDLKEKKITLPLIKLIENSDDIEKARLKDILAKPVISDEDFIEVKQMVSRKNILEICRNLAEQKAVLAKQCLQKLEGSQFSQALTGLIEFCVSRKY